MTYLSSPALLPAAERRGLKVSAISLTLLLVVLSVVLFLTLRSPLKDDIAWLMYVARRWMAGRELYVDVVEVNPPLIIWISAVPSEIAQWLKVDTRFVVMPMFIAFVLSCAWWSASLLRTRGGIFAQTPPVFAAVGTALLILPAVDLGQREHLLVAAFLPYLVLFASSLDGRPAPRVSSIAAGVLAGLGCALKPGYAAVFVVLECLALTRGLRPWRAMPLAAGMALVGYAGLVALVCPAYLERDVPMALALYGATDASFVALLSDSTVLLVGEGVAIGLLWLRRRRLFDQELMLTLTVFAATATVVCFADGKNWYYHRLPAIVTTVLALLLWIATELTQRRSQLRWPVLAACAAVTVFGVSSVERMEPEAAQAVELTPTVVDRLERILRDEHARTYVAFSEWIALGFPVVNETGVTWASRFDSMWALKEKFGVRGSIRRPTSSGRSPDGWRMTSSPVVPTSRWWIPGRPRNISVSSAPPIPLLRELGRAYRPIALFDGVVVYKRGKAGCLDVWVAAESVPVIGTVPKSPVDLR